MSLIFRNQKIMCRLHNGTHLWSDCAKNPKSKNYFMNPSSPFYRGSGRGGRGSGGRSDGRSANGRGERAPHNSGRGFGRGATPGGDSYYHGGRGFGRGAPPVGDSYYHEPQCNHYLNGGDAYHDPGQVGYDQQEEQYHFQLEHSFNPSGPRSQNFQGRGYGRQFPHGGVSGGWQP